MTVKKSAENQPIPSTRASWREAPGRQRERFAQLHAAAKRDGGIHTLTFVNSCFTNGFTCDLEGLTPALDKLAGLTGVARMAAAREQRIGSTTVTAEEQAVRTHAARMASEWALRARVDEQAVKREAAEARERATAKLAAELLAATAAATELEARARARAQAELEVARRGA